MNQRDLASMIASMHSTASVLDSLSESSKRDLDGTAVSVLGYKGMKDVSENIRAWANRLIELTPTSEELYVE